MEVEICNRPAFANLRARMHEGDRLVAESDAMVSMSPHVSIATSLNGGPFSAVARRVFGSESMFVNTFSAQSAGEVVLSQPLPGDIEEIRLSDTALYLQPGAFIACDPSVSLGVGWAGLASLIGREGLFRLKVSGTGRVWFGAYGSIFTREVEDELVVDSGHLVAYEPSLALSVGLPAGLFTSFFSGEGLVTRVRGPGRVYLQSRALDGLAAWTNSFLR